ncbi:hypothetical protein G5B40_16945 [Pikeienuella piscinae]|uniref:Flagellar protein FlgJ N-terminal domain-containing protein n=2 Tax=Pikeienuella piscinae TaxID=2748098 RepID=A0A7M3T7G3_9RHOB|nr:hypothetical protein G5B40_16945 [Pikeienuella piscinae]
MTAASETRPLAETRAGETREAALRKAATSFEAVFLSEMFAHVGLGAVREGNGGGVGEEAFASLLADEWAEKVASAGGLGLSERIYQALATREDGDA